MRNWLTLILFLLTVRFSYSQDSLKNTLVPIPLKYITAANKAYAELRHLKYQNKLLNEELSFKDGSILYYEYAIKTSQAKDSLNQQMILNRQETADEFENLYTTYKKAYRKERVRSILMYVLLPTAIGATAAVTYYIVK